MSKEKQIEEMAKILCGMKNGCDGCMWDKVHCNERNYSEEIYNAGYRKQNENTVEVVRCKDCKFNVANMDKDPLDITDYSGDDIVCSYFMTDGLEPADFCSHGAKMKGGAE